MSYLINSDFIVDYKIRIARFFIN